MELGKVPPHDLEAEQAILGSMLTDKDAVISAIEVLKEDYVRTARAKGIKEKMVVWKHAFRNSMISVVTVIGLQFGFLLGGSVVTESVFAFPGLGSLLIESVNYRDYPAIQSLILIFSLHFIIINLLVDILYAVLNPEIKLS